MSIKPGAIRRDCLKRLPKLLALALFLVPCASFAQTTAVSLQVTDAGGQQWWGGTWTADLVNQPGAPPGPWYVLGTSTPVPDQHQSGSLNSTGAASLTLYQNSLIAPAGSTWNLTVCPLASSTCYTQQVQAAGATQSTTITPLAILVSLIPPLPLVRLYSDIEAQNGTDGSNYYNLTDECFHYCLKKTCTGSNWVPLCPFRGGQFAGVNFYVDNTFVGKEIGLDLDTGSHITLTPVTDDPSNNRVHYTINATGGPAGCPAGASDTQYVDSAAGNDANGGTNWCDAKLTESAAVTALGGTGGWVYEAPNYTGARATGVPENVHILSTNQFDAHGSTAERFSFPDWDDVTEDHHAFASNSSSTLADAHTAYTALGPFQGLALISSVLGNATVPSTAAQSNSEQVGVAGIITNNSPLDLMQSDGVYGACYNPGAEGLDCSGVVAVAGNSPTGANGAYEAMWSELALHSTATDAMGLVIRAHGGHQPTTSIGPFSGRANAAIDLTYGGAPAGADAFYSGIFFENSSVNHWPIVFAANATTLNPHTDVFTYNRWHDYYTSGSAYDDLSVVKINNNPLTSQGTYQQGNYIFENSANASEVVMPINHSGTVSVDGINSVTFTGTDTFDRSKGKVQTIVLTGNETASTFQNCVAGQTVIFDIVEDGSGGHTFSAPANLHGFGAITTTAGYHNRQVFYCTGGSSYSEGYSVTAMQSGT
jgi:hypothetical protein